jgi:hypothetical protein
MMVTGNRQLAIGSIGDDAVACVVPPKQIVVSHQSLSKARKISDDSFSVRSGN